MTIRRIVTPPDPVLREKARKVRAFTSDIQTLIDDMIETMREAPGVGLAAPQVGVSQRVIVVEYGEVDEDPDAPEQPKKLYVVVNPEIVRHSKETVLGNEGCLSIPGYYGEVERYEWVTIKGYNRHGDAFRLKAKGWLARIFQHEVDHVDGVLFIDRATQVWEIEDEDHAVEGAPSS
jgi:peptide deformylase